MADENAIISWLRGFCPSIGDDAALIELSGRFVITVDTQNEGVHFTPGRSPQEIAARLLAVNLSDIAAMGARPRYAFSTLSAPVGFDHRAFLEALVRSAAEYGMELAGGDLASASQVNVTLTAIGEIPHGAQPLARHNARPGDTIWVGGALGEAALGLQIERLDGGLGGSRLQFPHELETAVERARWRHRRPSPQVELGLALGHSGHRVAAIDVSDGLGRDLQRLCRESRVGAVVHARHLPTSRSFHEICRHLRLDPLPLAAGGGEDYVLLFTLPPNVDPPAGISSSFIGEILEEPGVWLEEKNRRSTLEDVGWDHLAPSD